MTALGKNFNPRKLCRFPIFKEFNEENQKCEFLECNFNEKFDGLIGYNILIKLSGIID